MASLRVPDSVPDPSEDVEQLHKAFSGWGTNENLIIDILTHRNAAQRKAIRQAYSSTYGEDLLKALDKELTNDFERIVLLFTLDPYERDAYLVNEAITKKTSSTNWILIEIACTKSSNDLFQVRLAYLAQYKKSLEEDVAHHISGDYRKLIVPLLSAYRYEGSEVNSELAKTESKFLRDKITDKAYADDDVIRIITTRSKAQLSATFDHYNNEYGNAITKDMKADRSDFLKLLRGTIKCLTYPERYFEKLLRLSINKMGTDENALTRVVATRAEVDMLKIKEQYHHKNLVSLDQAIAKDTRGDYEKMLLELIGQNA